MRFFLLACCLWLSIGVAQAHEVRPAFLRAVEVSTGEFQVVWKQPVLSGQRLRITPTFPDGCTQTSSRLDRTSNTVAERFSVTCDLRQGALSLPGLERTLTDAFIEVSYLNGDVRTALLKPANPTLSLEGPQASPAKEYLRIGVEHIIYGWDHLLFVIGLTLLVAGRKVWAVATAFTLAHSITLAATAIGGITLPSRPVEILIAASIVLLAVEIMAKRKGHETWGVKRPFLIAFTIGLIHGFGFAGALAEIGLPQGTELLALFLFNLGVELGQFAVIGLVMLTLYFIRKIGKDWRSGVEVATTYAIAAIAMVWFLERTSQYFV